MKRLITASIMFMLVLLLCLFESNYISKIITNTKNTVQALENDCLNGIELSNERIERFSNEWQQKNDIIALFISRDNLSEVTDKIALLKATYDNSPDNFPILTREIILMLENIEKTEKINTFGIL